jgi:hypothetical protein
MPKDEDIYDIDPVLGYPRKDVRCPVCAKRYGHKGRKVCAVCGCCSDCCECNEDEKLHVEASVFTEEYLL